MAAQPVVGSKVPRFYTVAWRWHFYAGLLVTPIMIMLAITGIIYLFKPQLDPLMYRNLLMVTPISQAQQPADKLVAVVKTRFPHASVLHYQPPSNRAASAKVIIKEQGEKLGVYLDPYRATVLGTLSEERSLQGIARRLHGELMIGKTGDLLIEFAASWALVLLCSGLYLWWPRGRGKLAVFWLRRNAGGRAFWRDVHAVTGFWGALLLCFMLFSGLTWTGFWGKEFAAVWSRFPAQMWNQVPKSDKSAGSLNSSTGQLVPWAVEPSPLPKSTDPHAAHKGMVPVAANPRITLQQVVETAKARGIEPGYAIALPDGGEGVYTLSIFADDPRNDATLHIDQYSGKVLADIRFKDYGPVPKAVEMGVMLHEGKMFGWANQLLMLGVCLLVLLSAISGLVMWWKRRPPGRLGAPVSPPSLPLWKGGVLIMGVLGVAFPLVGASFLAVLALDWLVIQRLPSARVGFQEK